MHVEQDVSLWPNRPFSELNNQALNINYFIVIDGNTMACIDSDSLPMIQSM